MISIRDFAKEYDGFRAVKGISLEVERGAIFGFIGPNGAGKTTTIRFLATLLDPTRGRATVNGFDVVRQVRDVRRSIGYMPDSFGVYDGMRVWEFLDFFALAYGIDARTRARRIETTLALVDLSEKRDDFVNALSRGMKQRLCLAKTLVHDPPVLILDEPASGLDPRARIEMKSLLRELRSIGKTILISSHILSELADTCTAVGIIERGELLAAGPIDALLRELTEHRAVTVRVLARPDDARRWLEHHPRVAGVEDAEDRIRLEFSGTDEELADLADELWKRGHRPLFVQEERPSLEAVFMRVTKGRVQ